jgi:DNA polymerase (family 10)
MTHESDIPYPTNEEIARVLFQIASLLEMMDDNTYRVRAYRRAGVGVMLLQRQVAEYLLDGQDPPLPGVGERIMGRLHELVNTGQMGVYETFMDEIGEPLASLLAVHGIGPKTAVRLVRELQVGSLAELAEAARTGKIRRLRGFGAKREAKIAEQAELVLASAA